MNYAIIVEKSDSESGGVVSLDKKEFCSKECVSDFLFEEFEVEGINISDKEVINLTNCSITVCELDDQCICEYGCD